MQIDINRFKLNTVYVGKNKDGSLFIFKVIKKYHDNLDKFKIDVKIIKDDDSTYHRCLDGSTQTIEDKLEPFDCYTRSKEANDINKLLALII